MKESKKTFKNQKAFYTEQVNQEKSIISQLRKKSKLWVWTRLISFAIIPLTIYFFYKLGLILFIAVLLELLLFIFFIRKSVENKEQLNYHKNLLKINENELKALGYNYSNFESGSEFIDPKHRFSYDLDLFGEQSFFQFINRTITQKGKNLLAKNLLNGVNEVDTNKEAVEDLSKQIKWTQSFRASGKEERSQLNTQVLSLFEWTKKEISAPKWTLVYSWLSPFIAIALTLIFSLDIINGVQFVIFSALLLAPIGKMIKHTNETHKELNQIKSTLKSMERQLAVFQELKCTSEKLSLYQKRLFKGKKNGYEALKKLNKTIENFENRNNILVALLLNYYLAWDFKVMLSLSNWKKEFGKELPAWESVIYDLEFLISGATFRYNHSDYTVYAELFDSKDTISKIEVTEMGHPLIVPEKRVNNDYKTNGEQQFSIITGPNMAGKSTFLRSLGINLMLAQAGFPVIAEKFKFPDLKLYSSMRTTDDLSDESSYFHAELIRLRFIMDAIEEGENVFIILDEILKGTNSKDKEKGSTQFLQKLVNIKARGIIATHDLKLTELAENNSAIFNLYFDTIIHEEEIDFDYKLREGVAKNMNASFLLKKMELI